MGSVGLPAKSVRWLIKDFAQQGSSQAAYNFLNSQRMPTAAGDVTKAWYELSDQIRHEWYKKEVVCIGKAGSDSSSK